MIGQTEKHVNYATVVDTLPEAWTFVMEHVDDVGPAPHITISPIRPAREDPDDHPVYFEVSVGGLCAS